ncbi:CPBP family intramembrane metalloprotease [Nonomuraea sp. FMUSA5-5]|uniref:CPBP family intramembrane metalloprotease n=1 Tax=Nonomuraea composti TaxID=2720023 RepID=A0ABX1B1W8_9ACTN|nr:CPBP family intramembrane glutamic endopeptidase [Nonomuraea sp. FMUSA5-5]NJP91810.1 CPBP family intramembrane metalloprotease [Nonomuraea sp. FMUSA5-5]
MHPTAERSRRPVPPDVPYHLVLAGEKRRVGRGILAIVLLYAGLFGSGLAFAWLGDEVDRRLGRAGDVTAGTGLTPVGMAVTLASVALMIPWSMLIQRGLYGVRGSSLHSVASVFRLAVFGRAVLFLVPVWAVYLAVFYTVLVPYQPGEWAAGDVLFLFAATIVLAPLQSAGEEYGFRGLLFRVAASWSRGPRTALTLGVVVSAVLFAVPHLATDVWLNVYYLGLGLSFALITWRTGGIETSSVLHAANNVLVILLVLALWADLSTGAGMDRSAGAGSAVLLVPCALLAAITAVIWYRTRRRGPSLTPPDAAASGPSTPAARVLTAE